MHWMRRTSKGLYFDIEKGMLREMPRPPLKEGYSLVSCEYFTESHGHLYYVLACPDMPYLELFEMMKDYGGWVLKSQIDLRALAVDFPVMARRLNDPHTFFPCYKCDVLFVSRGLVAEDMKIMLCIPGEVIVYNHKKKFKKLCDTRLRPDDRAVWYRCSSIMRIYIKLVDFQSRFYYLLMGCYYAAISSNYVYAIFVHST
ncbi:hypothetical protein Cgig2_002544 [Carnegiea gigantea]|uniref:Uncharacterized protein n=1 Tax=Carnegiea gigantea TaxID=171969 RepID=A0A9Q1QP56_9CARY|nr:hypothetical protein Cgig2_002544 [Carnegiea gigantea]